MWEYVKNRHCHHNVEDVDVCIIDYEKLIKALIMNGTNGILTIRDTNLLKLCTLQKFPIFSSISYLCLSYIIVLWIKSGLYYSLL